jgi:hypothetical protein
MKNINIKMDKHKNIYKQKTQCLSSDTIHQVFFRHGHKFNMASNKEWK